VTVNKASPLDKYPIPKIEDLFSKLVGGQKFTKLASLPTALSRQGINQICDYKNLKGIIQIYQITIWHIICPSNFSTRYGRVTTRLTSCCSLFG